MSLELFTFIIAVIGWAYGFWQRSKAKEFESLFELSKSYEQVAYRDLYTKDSVVALKVKLNRDSHHMVYPSLKYNKDGSIAKKRGRPVGSKKK